MNILIIDDNSHLRALTKALLSSVIGIQHAGIKMVNCVNEIRQFDPCTRGDIIALEAAYELNYFSHKMDYELNEDWNCPHSNAMAPAIYLNKQIGTVAPHKRFKRGKFKRSSKR